MIHWFIIPALLFLGAAPQGALAAAPEPLFKVVKALNAFSVHAGDERRRLRPEQELSGGTHILTGVSGKAVVFGPGGRWQLGPDTELRFDVIDSVGHFELFRGTVLGAVREGKPGERWEVGYDQGLALVQGALFEASAYEKSFRVGVNRGVVELRDLRGATQAVVGEGQRCEVRGGAPGKEERLDAAEAFRLKRCEQGLADPRHSSAGNSPAARELAEAAQRVWQTEQEAVPLRQRASKAEADAVQAAAEYRQYWREWQEAKARGADARQLKYAENACLIAEQALYDMEDDQAKAEAALETVERQLDKELGTLSGL